MSRLRVAGTSQKQRTRWHPLGGLQHALKVSLMLALQDVKRHRPDIV